MTVQQYLESKKSGIVCFTRFEVGEGMEKRNDDFAAEVAAAAQAALK